MRALLYLLILGVTVYGIVDCAQADERTRRNVPLWVWVLIMVLAPGIGALIWLAVSRFGEPTPERPRNRPLAPDDDPEFLRELERRNRRRGQDGIEDQPPETGTDSDQPWGDRP